MSQGQESAFATPREVINWLRSLLSRIARRWRVIAVALAIGAALGALTPFLVLRPVYHSQVLLLYREGIQASSVLGQQAQEESRKRLAPRLKDMLLSRTHLEKVVGEFGLYPNTVARLGIIEAVDELRRHIVFKSHEDTFEVSYDGEDPQVVHDVTKRLGDALIEENARYRFEQAEATRSFLQAEEQRTSQELRGKEEALATFLAQHPEFAQDLTPGGGAPTAGASVRVAARQQAGAAAAAALGGDPRLQALERQAARLRESLTSPRPVAPPTHNADPALTAAKQAAENELASAQRDLADKQSKLTEQHPDVLTAKGRVRQAEARLEQAVSALKSGAGAGAGGHAAPVDEGSIKDQLRSVENAIAARRLSKKGDKEDERAGGSGSDVSNFIVSLETEWNKVNREAYEARERYNQIQDKLFKASILAGVEASGRASQMVIIDPAFKPVRPTKFGKTRVAAAVLGVALGLGLLIAFALALLDDRLYTERDLRSLGLGPVVHVIPPAGAKGS
ncbi:MAG TPA: Wzz/FepE/Etk N-terminal domain-containing protein [Polyangiaceae bacterium]|nr:Wzz/FepE/Etk N-terminal domain-containing protein [Polyangiaceae bacterium]